MFETVLETALIGVGATAFLDAVSVVRAKLSGAAMPDYAPVGRWFASLARGRFFHDTISTSARVRGERTIGWVAHYLTGFGFAAALLLLWPQWAREPTLLPALIVGIGSVAAPFLLMQPGMGLGVAASRTPDPAAARRRSFITHTIFAVGLYAAGWATSFLQF